eukprot:maker-scaffold261_size233860-snap-gene-0.14 protein:Tk10680 transcript:maker-scaffold261_size233860-snap-gene-0.14-mRNA-1 annotation:"headcase protein"
MSPHRRHSGESNPSSNPSTTSPISFDKDHGPWPCAAPNHACLFSNGASPEYITIAKDDLFDAVKIICSNDQCTTSPYLHSACFESFEDSVLQYLKSCPRAKSWTEKQRIQSLWTKRGYDLIYKACDCVCGHGHIRKDLDWIQPNPPPGRAAAALLPRHDSGGSIFLRRQDYSSFNVLPKHKINSYHIKMEDECSIGNDETRIFILSSYASNKMNRVPCVVCASVLHIFDRYPLIDGTFFLSPRQHNKSCIRVKYEGKTNYLTAVCMGCLEGWTANVCCRFCLKPWSGSHLILGTMYSYDIFAANPCCAEKLKCNNCHEMVIHPEQRFNFFSDYSQVVSCPNCGVQDTHFCKSLAMYVKQGDPQKLALQQSMQMRQYQQAMAVVSGHRVHRVQRLFEHPRRLFGQVEGVEKGFGTGHPLLHGEGRNQKHKEEDDPRQEELAVVLLLSVILVKAPVLLIGALLVHKLETSQSQALAEGGLVHGLEIGLVLLGDSVSPNYAGWAIGKRRRVLDLLSAGMTVKEVMDIESCSERLVDKVKKLRKDGKSLTRSKGSGGHNKKLNDEFLMGVAFCPAAVLAGLLAVGLRDLGL